MRLLQAFLVLSFFLLGMGITLVLGRPELACALGPSFAPRVSPAQCVARAAAVDEGGSEVETAEARAQPRGREVRPAAADPLAGRLLGAETRLEPGVVLPAGASVPHGLEPRPVLRPLDRRPLVVPGEAEAAAFPEHGAVAVTAAPAPSAARAGTSAPIRMTSVPVPRDPEAALRLLDAHYPRPLRESGIGGTVVLSLLIDRHGRVREWQAVEGSGHSTLDAAAVEIVRALRFTPAQQEGRSVETRVLHPVVFRP